MTRVEQIQAAMGEVGADAVFLRLPENVMLATGWWVQIGGLGIVLVPREAATEDQLMEVAVGAGADDYTDQGEEWQILTPVAAPETVSKALEAAKISVKSYNPAYIAKNKRSVAGREAELCLNLAEALDDHDDAQNVFSDFDIPEDELAKLAG